MELQRGRAERLSSSLVGSSHSSWGCTHTLLVEKGRTCLVSGTERPCLDRKSMEMGEPGELGRLCWLRCQLCPQRWRLLWCLFPLCGHSLHPQLEALAKLAAVVVFSPLGTDWSCFSSWLFYEEWEESTRTEHWDWLYKCVSLWQNVWALPVPLRSLPLAEGSLVLNRKRGTVQEHRCLTSSCLLAQSEGD